MLSQLLLELLFGSSCLFTGDTQGFDKRCRIGVVQKLSESLRIESVAKYSSEAGHDCFSSVTFDMNVCERVLRGHNWRSRKRTRCGETSDLLNITGDFNKGTGSLFRFDFGGSTEAGTFKLVDRSDSTTFAESDFSYVGLGGGNIGSFSLSGSQLNFTVIVTTEPEPSSMFLLGMSSVCGLVARYRRKT